MGTTLTGVNISASYLGLLKSTDSLAIGSTAKRITDGGGNDLPLSISTSTVRFQAGTLSAPALSIGSNSEGFYTPSDEVTAYVVAGQESLRLESNRRLKLPAYGSGTFTGTVTQRLGVTSSGEVVEIAIGGGAVDGSGTAGKITKWTDSDTIGDSIMTESSSKIGIGLTSPDSKLHTEISAGTLNTTNLDDNTVVGLSVTVPDATLSGGEGVAIALGMNGRGRSYIATNFTSANKDACDTVFYNESGGTIAEQLRISQLGLATFQGDITISNATPVLTLTDTDNSSDITFSSIGGVSVINASTQTFEIAGNEKMRLDSTGLGIGTTSPSEKLHVNGGHLEVQNAGNTNIYINAQADSDATLWFQEGGGAKGKIQNDASNDSILITDGANADTMTLKSQQVGIGTTTPVAKLDVVDGTNNNEGADATDFRFVASNRALTTERANMELYTNDDQAIDIGASIGFGGRHTDSSTNDSLFATIKSGKENATSANYAGYLSFGISKSDSDIEERMRLDSSGNLGIGTTAPADKLVVKGGSAGNADLVSFQNSNGNETHRFYADSDNDGVIETVTNAGTTANLIQSSGSSYFNGGSVGIGTTSPNALLDLDGGKIRVSSSGTRQLEIGTDATISFGSDDNIQVRKTGSDLQFKTGGSERMRIDSSGNVGIGTTSPNTILEIASGNSGGDGALDAPIFRINNTTESADWDVGDVVGSIEYYTSDASGNAPYVTSFIKSVNETGNGTLPDGALSFGTATYNASGGAIERMRIDSSGNVGIATDSPGAKLQIGSATHAPNGNLSNNLLQIKSSSSFAYLTIGNGDTADSTSYIGGASGFTTLGSVTDAGVLSEHVRITLDGSVGVGTTSPATKLHVYSASADAQGVVYVEQNPATNDPTMVIQHNTAGGNANSNQGLVIKSAGTGDGKGNVFHAYQENGSDTAMVIKGGSSSGFGMVGIGTSSPAELLQVQGFSGLDGSTPPTIKIHSSNAGTWTDDAIFARLAFGNEDQTGGIACSINAYVDSTTGNNAGLTFYTSASANTPAERVRIDKDGKLGIGATNPTGKLEIQNAQVTTQFDRDCFVRLHPSATTDAGGFTNIFFGTSTTNNFGVALGGKREGTGDGEPTFAIRMLDDSITGTEVLNINNAGKLKLNTYGSGTHTGTATKFLAVDTNGNVIEEATSTIDGSGTAGKIVKWSDADTITDSIITESGTTISLTGAGTEFRITDSNITNTDYNTFVLEASAQNIFSMGVGTTTGGTYTLSIDGANSRLGIGTTSPHDKLHVVGNVFIEDSSPEITFETTGSSHSNWQIACQENIDDGFEISVGSEDATGHDDTFTPVLSLKKTGNVGIGITPVERLDLQTSSGDCRIRLDAPASSDTEIKFFNDGSAQYTIGHDDATDNFVIGGANVDTAFVSVDKSGDVGIGTTSPSSKLNLLNSSGNTDFLIESGTASSVTGQSTISMISRNASSGTSPTSKIVSIFEDSNDSALAFHTTDAGTTAEKMRITSAGSIGIGTTSPAKKLEVDSGTSSDIAKFGNDNGGFVVGYTTNLASIDLSATSQKFRIRQGSSVPLTIDDSQNVGIGVTNPTFRLAVDASDGNVALFQGTRDFGLKFVETSVDSGLSQMQIIGNNSASSYNALHLRSATGTGLVIDTSNNVIIGGDAYGDNGAVSIGSDVDDGAGQIVFDRATSLNTSIAIDFQNAGTSSGSISFNSSTTAYATSSDYRLKEDYQDFNALEIASNIKMYDFKWKNEDKRSYGVKAHELQDILPDAVTGEKDGEEMQGVDYSKLVPILLKSIQELEARVKELEKEI